jgi:hypothetical protein
MQRQMIGVLAGGKLRQQAGAGQTFFDDGDRHVADGDMVMTLRASILEADMLTHKQAGGMVVELLADVLAELLANHLATKDRAARLPSECALHACAADLGAAVCGHVPCVWPWSSWPPRRPAARRSPPRCRRQPEPSRGSTRAGWDRSVPLSDHTACARANRSVAPGHRVTLGVCRDASSSRIIACRTATSSGSGGRAWLAQDGSWTGAALVALTG